ncbi:MAG TPA: protease complex subunit PrcB family protein [Bacillota bacterium]|nr:protease complex subunit PrcB family protein [Bacillota bacterium]
MRKLIVLLGLLLVLAAPVAVAAPRGNSPVSAASVAYMPVHSLSGLFGARVTYKANTGSEVITLTFSNNQTATLNVRTNIVTYKGITRTLQYGVLRKGGNVFVPINELRNLFTDVGAKVPPGKALIPKQPSNSVPATPTTSTVSFSRLPSVNSVYAGLQTEQPVVLLGKASKVLTNLSGISPNADVLLVYRGKFLTGGYAIEVQSLTVVNGVLHIGVKLTNPTPGAVVTQAITYPYDVVVLGNHAQFTQWQMNFGGNQPTTGTIIQLP